MRWPLQPLQPFQQTQLQPPFGQSVASLCHPWFTTTNFSYRLPIFETSATALCGTTGTDGNLHVFCHKGSKSFQNIAFDSVFAMLPVKHTVIYTFFAITSAQNTCFCSVFNALASKNPAKSCYVQCFFHFRPFFHCRKATKMTQNSISIPSCAQTPKNPRKMSKTPPNSGLGAKPFLAPPAKADIATAILTNVIEHLV